MLQRLYLSIAGSRRPAFPAWLHLSRLPSPIIYLISVVATKAVSLITIPVMAAYLPPSDYGNYDVAISFLEFVGLTLGLAIGATLIRFSSTAGDEQQSRQTAREMVGTILCIVLLVGTPFVVFGPAFLDHLGIEINHTALRVMIAAATVSGLIELPLIWLRLKDRAALYFLIVMTRTMAQALLIWLMLWNGFGVTGVMFSNGFVLLLLATFLIAMQIRDTGIAVSRRALMQVLVYGLPIVGADLAMFGLGNANKLFMPAYVSPEVIAHFGLAARIALIMSLATSPFDLWWTPRRIAILTKPGGLERAARMWALGIAIVTLAGAGVALAGPLLVHVLLPASYGGTIAFIAPLVVVQSMHIITIFTNVGSFARSNGSYVFGIEVFSALIAIAGYCLLIQTHGAWGVIIAMALGQIARFGLHLWYGQELAPLPYPWIPALITVTVAMLLVLLAPPDHWLGWRFLYTLSGLGVITAVTLWTGLVKIPASWIERLTGGRGRSC